MSTPGQLCVCGRGRSLWSCTYCRCRGGCGTPTLPPPGPDPPPSPPGTSCQDLFPHLGQTSPTQAKNCYNLEICADHVLGSTWQRPLRKLSVLVTDLCSVWLSPRLHHFKRTGVSGSDHLPEILPALGYPGLSEIWYNLDFGPEWCLI